jgi:predicted acetyltransferase
MSDELFLVKPSLKYEQVFCQLINDYKNSNEKEYYEMYKEALEDYNEYVRRLNSNAEGIDLPKGWVPCHTYWLSNNDNEILGSIRIREYLNNDFLREIAGHIGYDISPRYRRNGYGKTILKLGLEKAKDIGLNKVLVTCDFDNYPSKKIIEANKGVFESEIYNKSKNKKLRRYWIEIDK